MARDFLIKQAPENTHPPLHLGAFPRAVQINMSEGGVAIAKPGSFYLFTTPMFPCVSLVLHAPKARAGAIAHFSIFDNPGQGTYRTAALFSRFLKQHHHISAAENWTARLIGGSALLGKPHGISAEIVAGILKACGMRGLRITGADLYARQTPTTIALDLLSGEIIPYDTDNTLYRDLHKDRFARPDESNRISLRPLPPPNSPQP